MACWHVCRTFTGFGEIQVKLYSHDGCESWGNLSSPTNPHYHYIMSSVYPEGTISHKFIEFFSYTSNSVIHSLLNVVLTAL